MRTASTRSTSLLYRWVPSVGLAHVTTSRWSQGNITWGSTPVKKRVFCGRSLLRTNCVSARPRKSTNSEEVSKIKALWWAREVTKPDYVKLCNQIHLLDLQDNKGGEDREEATKAKQNLMMDLVGRKMTHRAQNKPEQAKGLQTRSQQASPRRPAVAGSRPWRPPRQAKRRQCNGRIIPGETRILTETPQQMAKTEA